jgi:hypothetical protein
MTGKRQPVDLVRTLLSFSSFLLLIVMVVWPNGMLAPDKLSNNPRLTNPEGLYQSSYMSDYSLNLDYSWQRELLHAPGWDHPNITPKQAVP